MFGIVDASDGPACGQILMVLDDQESATEVACQLNRRGVIVDVLPVGTEQPYSVRTDIPLGDGSDAQDNRSALHRRPRWSPDAARIARRVYAIVDLSQRPTRGQMLMVVDDRASATEIAAELNLAGVSVSVRAIDPERLDQPPIHLRVGSNAMGGDQPRHRGRGHHEDPPLPEVLFAIVDASRRDTWGQILMIVDDHDTATEIASDLRQRDVEVSIQTVSTRQPIQFPTDIRTGSVPALTATRAIA